MGYQYWTLWPCVLNKSSTMIFGALPQLLAFSEGYYNTVKPNIWISLQCWRDFIQCMKSTVIYTANHTIVTLDKTFKSRHRFINKYKCCCQLTIKFTWYLSCLVPARITMYVEAWNRLWYSSGKYGYVLRIHDKIRARQRWTSS